MLTEQPQTLDGAFSKFSEQDISDYSQIIATLQLLDGIRKSIELTLGELAGRPVQDKIVAIEPLVRIDLKLTGNESELVIRAVYLTLIEGQVYTTLVNGSDIRSQMSNRGSSYSSDLEA